jgi:BMFP domain-containing protein YqiC
MFELMMPLMKNLQDKTYTPDMFKQMFNASIYKDMMDKMFNMQPDFMKNMMSGMNDEMKNNMGKMMDMNKNIFDNMKSAMTSQFSNMMPNDMFTQGLNHYNNWYNQMNTAMAPLTKLMPVNSTTQAMETMKEMSNMMAVYNMKNNQLQNMMYTTGLKAMEQFSEALYTKMRNGEQMSSFMPVYNEWLSLHDKNFIALFETEEYSKLMSEVSALQLNLKKQVDLQMEKAMANLPIINRTEMDELYKTIYELRKRINTLEKQMDSGDVVSEEPKVAPKKTAKNA